MCLVPSRTIVLKHWFVIVALIVSLSKNGPSKSTCMFCLTTYALKHVAHLWIERWKRRRNSNRFVFLTKCVFQSVFVNFVIDLIRYWMLAIGFVDIDTHAHQYSYHHAVMTNFFYCSFVTLYVYLSNIFSLEIEHNLHFRNIPMNLIR